METIGNTWLYLAFFGLVTIMLIIDFLAFAKPKVKTLKLKLLRIGVLLGSRLPHYLVADCGCTYNKPQVLPLPTLK